MVNNLFTVWYTPFFAGKLLSVAIKEVQVSLVPVSVSFNLSSFVVFNDFMAFLGNTVLIKPSAGKSAEYRKVWVAWYPINLFSSLLESK